MRTQKYIPICLKLLCVCVCANYQPLATTSCRKFHHPFQASNFCGVCAFLFKHLCIQWCTFRAHKAAVHAYHCVLLAYRCLCVNFWMCHSVSEITEMVALQFFHQHNIGGCNQRYDCTIGLWRLTWRRVAVVSVRFLFPLSVGGDMPTAHSHTNHTLQCNHTTCVQTHSTHTCLFLYCSTCPHFFVFLTPSPTNFSPLLLTSEPTLWSCSVRE